MQKLLAKVFETARIPVRRVVGYMAGASARDAPPPMAWLGCRLPRWARNRQSLYIHPCAAGSERAQKITNRRGSGVNRETGAG